MHIAEYIRQRMRQANLNVRELARKSGLSPETIYQLQKIPSQAPNFATLTKLAHALEIHPLDLLQRAWDEYPCHMPVSNLAVQGDRSVFIDDITIPDGMICHPKQRLTKIWRIQNVGNQAWHNRYLMCVDGIDQFVMVVNQTEVSPARIQPQQPMIAIPETHIGDTVDLSVEITAPQTPGRYLSYWKMCAADGTWSFPNNTGLTIQIRVLDIAHSAVCPKGTGQF